jgi:hypothetical protein
VGAEEVADREVTELVLASHLADVDVVRARALCGLAEEVEVGPRGIRGEEIAQILQRSYIHRRALDGRDRQLKVEDRLRCESRHRGGTDVLQPHGDRANGFPDATELVARCGGPLGVVLDDLNRRVEAVVQRRMPRRV